MRKTKLLTSTLLIITLIISFTSPSFAEETTYVWSSDTTPVNTNDINNSINTTKHTNTNSNASDTTNKTNHTIATNAENEEKQSASNTLNLESPSAILIEQSTGQVLYEHNCHEALRPASVTKVMSILLIMEALDERKNCFK